MSAVPWIQSTASGPEWSCSYSTDPVSSFRPELFVFRGSIGGWIDDGVGAPRKMFELRSEIRGVECGGDAAYGLAAVTRTGDVLVLRRRVGNSVLGGGVCGGSFLRGGFGTAAATSSVTGAMLICDCWWKW